MSAKTMTSYALVLCASGVFAITAFGQSAGQNHQRWIEEEVSAILTQEETRHFSQLTSDADLVTFREIFWLRRDPDLSTPANEFRQAYERRIEIADEQLRGRFGPGSRTALGQIFLLFGFPSSVAYSRDATPAEPDRSQTVEIDGEIIEGSTTEGAPGGGAASLPRLQTWQYAADGSISLGYGLTVEFRAQPTFGYRLVKSDALDEIAESQRRSFVEHPDISYEFDINGDLLPPVVPLGPSLAAELLEVLLGTKSAGGALSLTITPAYFRSRENTTYVPVLMHLDAGSVSLTDGTAGLTFFGALENSDGEVVERFVERASLRANAGLRFEMPLQLAPGHYTAYMGVVDATAGTHGIRIGAIQVPDFAGETLQLSSVVVYRGATPTNGPAGVPGRAFQFGNMKFDPIGDQALGPADSVGIFYYVYGVAGTDVTARYIFYKDGVEKAQTRPKALTATDGIAFASDEIPLESFESGDYVVLVRVVNETAAETIQSRVRFSLRR